MPYLSLLGSSKYKKPKFSRYMRFWRVWISDTSAVPYPELFLHVHLLLNREVINCLCLIQAVRPLVIYSFISTVLPSHLRLYQKQTSLYGCCGRLEKSWISWFEKEHTYQLFRNHLNLIQSTSPPFYNDCHAKIIVMRHRHCLKNDRKANCSGKVCEDEGKYIQ